MQWLGVLLALLLVQLHLLQLIQLYQFFSGTIPTFLVYSVLTAVQLHFCFTSPPPSTIPHFYSLFCYISPTLVFLFWTDPFIDLITQ